MNNIMKKRFAFLIVALVLGKAMTFSTPVFIPVSVNYDTERPAIPPMGKAPAHAPSVWLDGHELSFPSEHPLYTLTLLQDGEEVFATIVTEGTGAIVLPSWLTGEYELVLAPESCYYFYGIVVL